MQQKKKVTIYDLAEKLSFSPSTISRALNDHKSISPKTIKAIKEAARELGYRPNVIAASLRNAKSSTLGIMISRINRPFISSLISGIEEYARVAGSNVIICQSHDNYANEVNNAKMMLDNQVGGLIVSLSMETVNYDHFKTFPEHGVPIVFVDRVPMEFNSYKVTIDNFAAGYKATEHLIGIGCKRIAHYGGARHVNIYSERMEGYIAALRSHAIEIDEDLIYNFDTLSHEEGTRVTAELLCGENPPDGIFAANDTSAVAAILCAKEHNVAVPDDLAIIGFNDDPIASIVDPQLSTIYHPAAKMGEISAKRILEHNYDEYDHSISEVTILNTELIIRKSTNRKVLSQKAR